MVFTRDSIYAIARMLSPLRLGGVRKFSDFLAFSVNISKTVADTAKVTISH